VGEFSHDLTGWWWTEQETGPIVAGQTAVPEDFTTLRADPNPFNLTTVIRYQMPDARQVNLKIFDIAGRLVATLVDGWSEAGSHTATFDGSGLASGIYLAKLQAGEYFARQKLVLIK
jgi:hypothetical protein